MSLQFNNTTTKNGIIQRIERNCGFNDGDISGNTTRLAQFTGDINVALDAAVAKILAASGTWQFDDSNNTDYPIITTNIVSGQRDYSFTTDGSSNLVLGVYRVLLANSNGVFAEIQPVDQATPNTNNNDTTSFISGANTTGTPNRYDKFSNGIFLDPIPNYNYTGGLKLFVNREASHFVTSDTTKKPGFAGSFHEYLVLKVSYEFARGKLKNENSLLRDLVAMERSMEEFYGAEREKDAPSRLRANVENCK